MGYAQYMLYVSGKTSWRSTGRRILKLLINYWIILAVFSIIGLIYSQQNLIPGALIDFLKSIVLLHSYNGAWWFLNTYIIFLLIPSVVKLFPVKKIPAFAGLILCLTIQVGWYFVNRLGLWPIAPENNNLLTFVFKELHNFINVLPAAWAGAFLCKGDVINKIYDFYSTKIQRVYLRKLVLGIIWFVLFVSMNLIHKAVLTLIFAVLSFLIFNIWEKGKIAGMVWSFLGKHSTNIWLTHMFFYATLFVGLVQKVNFPLLMLGFILALCIVVSYFVLLIDEGVNRLLLRDRNNP